jgi:hypothetical protein
VLHQHLLRRSQCLSPKNRIGSANRRAGRLDHVHDGEWDRVGAVAAFWGSSDLPIPKPGSLAALTPTL